jgi:hypothetical protein
MVFRHVTPGASRRAIESGRALPEEIAIVKRVGARSSLVSSIRTDGLPPLVRIADNELKAG